MESPKAISVSPNFGASFTSPEQRFGKWYTMADFPDRFEMANEKFGIGRT